MWPNPQFPGDYWVTFTEEICNGKLHFLCSVKSAYGFVFGSLWHFITKCGRHYCKMRQLFHYKMRQKLWQNASGVLLQNVTVLLQNPSVITKCVDFITKFDSYCKMRRLLQNAPFHFYQRVLFSKERVKYFRFLFKICYLLIFVT